MTTTLEKYIKLSEEIPKLNVYDNAKQKELIELFNNLSWQDQKIYQYLQLHLLQQLERLHNIQKDVERKKFVNMGYPLPTEVKNSNGYPPHADLKIVMQCDNTIHSIFAFEHLHNILLPKRCFMIYGADGSGKTNVATKMYDVLVQKNPDIPILYLRDNIQSWQNETTKRWESLVSYVTFVIENNNNNGWILLELEHFDLLKNFNYDTLKPFIELQRVIVLGVTDNPQVCEEAFKNNFSMNIFVDYPYTHQIKEILTLWFLKLIHNQTDVSRKKSQYRHLWTRLSAKIDEISLKLTCHKTISEIKCENKTKCKELRLFSDDLANDQSLLKYGITMSLLHDFLIPRLEGCIVKLRKNWYNEDKKCFVEPFHKDSVCQDNTKNKTKLAEILDNKTQSLTKNQLLTINNDNLTCDKIKQSVLCNVNEDFQLNWKWVSESHVQIMQLMDEILLNVAENNNLNQQYKSLVEYFINH